MTKKDFEQLHRECSEALHDYLAAATKLCKMLGDCAEQKLSLEQRSGIADQRTRENSLFSRYHKIRDRLLEAARAGYGAIE